MLLFEIPDNSHIIPDKICFHTLYHMRLSRLTSAIFAVIAAFLVSIPVFADNRSELLDQIDELLAEIETVRSDREAMLLDHATALSDRYATALADEGVNPDHVDILLGAKKLLGTTFRQEVTAQYRELSDTMFDDIAETKEMLSELKTDITLGASSVTDAERSVYEQTITEAQSDLETFRSESQQTLDTFLSDFLSQLDGEVERVRDRIGENRDFLTVIADMERRYDSMEERLTALKSSITDTEETVLDRLQNNVTLLSEQKATLIDRMDQSLDEAVERAMSYSRLREREQDIRVYRDLLLDRFESYLETSFHDDEDLLLSYLAAKNIVESEPELRERIYDESGTIRYDRVFEDADELFSEIQTLWSDISDRIDELDALKARYENESALGLSTDLSTQLSNAYRTKRDEYEAEFQTYLENIAEEQSLIAEQVETKNEKNELEKRQNESYIAILELEKDLFDKELQTGHSVEYAERILADFIERTHTVAQEGNSRVQRRAQQLQYAARLSVLDRAIRENEAYTAFAQYRVDVVKSVNAAIADLEDTLGKDATLDRLKTIIERADALKDRYLSPSVRYQIDLVRRAAYEYLSEN